MNKLLRKLKGGNKAKPSEALEACCSESGSSYKNMVISKNVELLSKGHGNAFLYDYISCEYRENDSYKYVSGCFSVYDGSQRLDIEVWCNKDNKDERLVIIDNLVAKLVEFKATINAAFEANTEEELLKLKK